MNNQEDTSNNKLAEEMMEHQNQSFSDAHHLLEMYQPHYEKFLLKKQFSLDEIKKFLSLLTDDDAMFATLYKATHNTLLSRGFDTASIAYQVLSLYRMQQIEKKSKLLSDILIENHHWQKDILREGLAFLDISNNYETAMLSGRNNSFKEKVFRLGKRKGPPVDIKLLLPIGSKLTLLDEVGKKDNIWVANFATTDEPDALLGKEIYIWNSELEVMEVGPFKLKLKHTISDIIFPFSPLILTTPVGIRLQYD